MKQKLKLYQVNVEYAKYLSKHLANVTDSYSPLKQTRKYVGIIIMQGSQEYLVPLSSPKEKHKHMKNNIDFLKIAEGNLGVINFNNMIPVNQTVYDVVKFSKITDITYRMLLQNQYAWFNHQDNKNTIIMKAENLYTLQKENNLPEKIKSRCVNFDQAEKLLIKYIREKQHSFQR